VSQKNNGILQETWSFILLLYEAQTNTEVDDFHHGSEFLFSFRFSVCVIQLSSFDFDMVLCDVAYWVLVGGWLRGLRGGGVGGSLSDESMLKWDKVAAD
jgi:hypothetical protein